MVYRRAEPGQWKAGVLAVLMHLLFLGVLIFGVSWQNTDPGPVTVQLWDALPGVSARPPKPTPAPPKPAPVPKPVPKPTPKPPEPVEPKPAKPDIALKTEKEKARKEKEQRELAEKKRHEQEVIEREKEKRRLDDEQKKEAEKQKKAAEAKAAKAREREAQREQEAARKAEADAVAARQAAHDQAVDGYVGKLRAKIRQRIVDQPCQPLGDPEVVFFVTLMPTGELLFEPKLVKSSGAAACDQAIERAIQLANPFPKPDPALGIRDLNLKFRPNRKE